MAQRRRVVSLMQQRIASSSTSAGGGSAAGGGTMAATGVASHGAPMPPPAAVQARVDAVFEAYGRYWFDAFRLLRMDRAEIERSISVVGEEHLRAVLAGGGGCVLAMPHVGNWDLGGAWLAGHYPLTVVAERVEPPALFDWFVSLRERSGIRVVPLDQHAAGALLKDLRAGRVLGLLCDRDLTGDGIPVQLFGEATTLPAGPATLALRVGVPVLPTVVFQTPEGPARGVIGPPIRFERTGRLRDDVAALTQAIADALAALIAAEPLQWHVLQPNWPNDRT